MYGVQYGEFVCGHRGRVSRDKEKKKHKNKLINKNLTFLTQI